MSSILLISSIIIFFLSHYLILTFPKTVTVAMIIASSSKSDSLWPRSASTSLRVCELQTCLLTQALTLTSSIHCCFDLPRSGMELEGSSKDGGLRRRGGGGGGGGGGRIHWMTDCVGAGISTGARNSLPGGAGSSSRRTGSSSGSYPLSEGSRLGDIFG